MEFYDKLKFCGRFREKTLNHIGPLKIYSKSVVTCVKFLYRLTGNIDGFNLILLDNAAWSTLLIANFVTQGQYL